MEKNPITPFHEIETDMRIGRDAYVGLVNDFYNALTFAIPSFDRSEKARLMDLIGTFRPGQFIIDKMYDPEADVPGVPALERLRLIRNSMARKLLSLVEERKDAFVSAGPEEEKQWNAAMGILEASLIK